MLLSIALVFSLVAVVAETKWTNRTSLGMLSRYYETGSIGDADAAGVISTVVGDPGGKSYGAYMFTIKSGTVLDFINWCRNTAINSSSSVEYAIGEALYKAYTTGGVGFGALFDETWENMAEPSPVGYGSAFFHAQEAFSKTNIYDVAIDFIEKTEAGKNFKIDYYSLALKNVIWSRAVHHGPEGARDIVVRAFENLGGFANQSESELIMAIYEESGRVVTPSELFNENGATAETMNGSTAAKYDVDGKILRYWYGSSDAVQLAVYRRLNVNEPNDALSILQSNAFDNLIRKEGNYTIALQKDSSTLALGVVGNDVKVVNTADQTLSAAKFTLNYLAGAGTTGAYTISTAVPTENGGTKTMRLAASTISDGFGSVTLADPSTSDSQLWYIDSEGKVTNKTTSAYLASRNDTLVVVGANGADVSQSVTVIAFNTTNNKEVTGQTAVVENNTTTTKPAGPKVTYVADEYGTFKTDETLVLTSTTVEDSTTYTLGALPTLTPAEGYIFEGWYEADGTEAVTGDTTVTDNTTLYARYTHTTTSKTSPAVWSFSPVVADASDFTVHQLIYPDEDSVLYVGNSGFPVRGMISCSDKISKVELTISGSAMTISDYAEPNASYYDLSELDSTIAYSSLSAGDYTYELTATVNEKVIPLKTSNFSVATATTSSGSTSSGSSENTVTVTFNAGSNGNCTTKSKTYSLDNVIYGTLPSVTANSGYGFAGWFTAPTGGVEVLPGTQIVAENITLYAQYTKIYTYTFTGASGSSASGSAAAGTVFYAPSSSNAPWKAPDANYTYTFSHWSDGVTSTKYYSGQAIVMGEGNMTFTPVYTQKAITSTPSGGNTTGGSTGGGNSGGGSGGGSSTTTTPSGPVWTLTPGVSVSQMEGTVYSNGKVVSSGNIATGMTVKTSTGEYTIAVTGDTSGDGKITVTDVVKLQSHLLNKTNLSGAYLEAADLNSDNKVSITDLVKSARVVAGKDTIG